ncbi:MAG: TetR family transcriptional regulator [Bacteroidetes bacterium]|nr:TetR family transcriptional regulator [Bacteroidota bacterium]
MRRRKDEAERTKDALLDAALAVFSRQGIQATRLQDIAAEAHVTRGAIYWHFGGKEGIIRELLQRRLEPVLAVVADVRARPLPAIQRIEILIRELLTLIEHSPQMRDAFMLEFERTLFGSSDASMHPVMQQSTRQFEKVIHRLIDEGLAEGSIRRDIPADDLLGFLLCIIKGMLIDTRMRQQDPAASRRAPDPALSAGLAVHAIGIAVHAIGID